MSAFNLARLLDRKDGKLILINGIKANSEDIMRLLADAFSGNVNAKVFENCSFIEIEA